jgi:hypothetical protein
MDAAFNAASCTTINRKIGIVFGRFFSCSGKTIYMTSRNDMTVDAMEVVSGDNTTIILHILGPPIAQQRVKMARAPTRLFNPDAKKRISSKKP